ncbi:MAG: M20/M25/M40 family metallo-hydrolase [Spirochaetaceae bacterium]|nr:M20/M25/M40 family metallo-hydrolase [Spirochaetaceae bacterium]
MTAVDRLSELIKMPTVSAYEPKDEDDEVFAAFPDRLAALYPAAHGAMERRLVGDRGVVYTWRGTDSHLEPILGLAHYDVVPPGEEEAWDRPPFSGEIADGRIHGRGSLDDKGMLAGWMEAVERLAARDFRPERTLVLAFGGDEETSGFRGAGSIASLFREEGRRFAFVLDEGGAVATEQLSAFTDKPVALIGCAEKGYLTLTLNASGMSGHASAPPKRSAVGRLSAALAALEANPAPSRLVDVPIGMLRALGHAVGGLKGFILTHPRLFRRVLLKNFAGTPSTASMIRTTLAPTVIRGGERDNVMPDKAVARINLRILPGETVESVTGRVRSIVASAVDGGVTVEHVEGSVFEPVPAGLSTGVYWDRLKNLAESIWPDVVVAPYLMTGTTDSRWYRDLSDSIFRFIPMEVGTEEMKCVHAPNESVSVKAWESAVEFLERLIGTGGSES